MGDIDPAFIQSREHRPKSKAVEAGEISVIDLSSQNKQQLISEIGKACEEWGFFQVIKHGVPFEVSRKAEIVADKFFEQSIDEKKKVKRDEDTTQVPSSHEPHDKELRTLTNQWPQHPSDFREALQECAREVEKLAFKLFELILLSLGLAGHKFHGCFRDQLSMVRLNHNPPCPFPDLALGVGRHKDEGALTVPAQDDVGGLQV
ncbi:hypothetical protein RIF29_15007 [Crotalaria pallida]|uniref:Non-haem dioxygenase N-terminal domain-containing protein n=1 Tax=Crotalaria pallida TaxID=3830 RepID=A0AAN9ID89_CROPI